MNNKQRKLDEVKQALLTISVNAEQAEVIDKPWWSNGRRRFTFEIIPEDSTKKGDGY